MAEFVLFSEPVRPIYKSRGINLRLLILNESGVFQ